jgi:hypothetical protein
MINLISCGGLGHDINQPQFLAKAESYVKFESGVPEIGTAECFSSSA